MVHDKIRKVLFRRRREQKTNYKKRLGLLKSKKNRLVVRVFNKNILAQIVEYRPTGDLVVASAYSKELNAQGWDQSLSNTSAAYLTGLLLAKKLKSGEAVLDTGLQRVQKGGKIYAVLKGAVDGGLDIPYSEEVFPSEDRIKGEHVAAYDSKQFTKVKPKDIVKTFDKVKEKILKV